MTDLSLAPVVIAIQSIKLAKRSDDLKLRGVDLESGQLVLISVRYLMPTTEPRDPISGLLLKLSLHTR
ncbi:hypothetical protein [Brevundimonas diminuta]|uniref:hypothetical protein n=1 Tax=Brevundimonas diminuta TaxID=293 RepID=UPI001F58109B|nr:hypothetical protein [Brevundimonas diminuta]